MTVPSSGSSEGWERQEHLVKGRPSQGRPKVIQTFPSLPNPPKKHEKGGGGQSQTPP